MLIGLVFVSGFGKAEARTAGSLATTTSSVAEGDDFATTVLGQPWDMNGSPYPDFPTATKNINRTNFKAQGGRWEMESTNSDPRLWLHWSGIANTQNVLKLGDRFPIDTSKYRLLSFHLCTEQDSLANAYWMYDRSPHDDPSNGVMQYLPTTAGCDLYVVDLPNFATFNGSWSGSLQGFRLDPAIDPIDIDMAWVRLTTRDFSNTVGLDWSGVDPDTDLDFYLSETACHGSDRIRIGETTATTSSGQFLWGAQLQSRVMGGITSYLPLPESFEPGNYHLSMEDEFGSHSCSGLLNIHQAPILSFSSPSFVSGVDYASTAVEDPWGMSNAEDIALANGFDKIVFDDGILTADTISSDSQLHLNIEGTVNTNKYYYATFRMYLEGEQSISNGWVQRFFWWYTGPAESEVTQDMVLYEGWHTYTVDLSQAMMETTGGWDGQPINLRFDPHESRDDETFHLDYIALTGIQEASSGSSVPIIFNLETQESAEITFYYDTDTNPASGRTSILEYLAAKALQQAESAYSLFLPTVMFNSPGELNLLSGLSLLWDTTGVPTGTYYISADVDDGVMMTTWYSEAPLDIK